MTDKPCPQCGCYMEVTDHEIPIDFEGEDTVTEVVHYCPCCDYHEETYED